MYTGNLFNYLRSMGVRVPKNAVPSGSAAAGPVSTNVAPVDAAPTGLSGNSGGLVVVKAFGNGFAGGFFPSAEEYAVSVETDKVLKALKVIMEACNSKLGIILVSEDRQDILSMLKSRLKDEKSITVLKVDGYSGAGLDNILGEYMLKVRSYAGNAFSAAESPPAVYSSLELLRAYDALTGEKPVTRALVYCGGEVASPGFYDIPVGTRYSDVVEACSPLLPVGDYVILTDNLSHNNLQYAIERDISAPIKKDTEKLIILPLNHPLLEKVQTPLKTMLKRISSVCNQCRLCTDMCPVYLNGGNIYPHLIVRDTAEGKAGISPWIAGATLCISCGVCMAVCPASISPMQINEFIKGVIHNSGGVNRKTSHGAASAVSDYVHYRKLPAEKLAEYFGLTGDMNSDWIPAENTGLKPAVHTVNNVSVAELMLSQAGADVKPVVKAGDGIAEGALIASGSENGGPSLHASIGGRVGVVDDERIVIVSAGE